MAYVALGDLTRNAGRSRDAEPWYRQGAGGGPAFAGGMERAAAVPQQPRRPERAAGAGGTPALRRGVSRTRIGAGRGPWPDPGGTHESASATCRAISSSTRWRCSCVPSSCITTARSSRCSAIRTTRREDGMTRDIRSRVEHWRNIAGQDDAAAARAIRADDLDILIDLSGHSARSRILLFNQRCAPVQATWLGYLNTTGLRSADFRLCDRYTDPAGVTDALHTETLMRLARQPVVLPAGVRRAPRAVPVRDVAGARRLRIVQSRVEAERPLHRPVVPRAARGSRFGAAAPRGPAGPRDGCPPAAVRGSRHRTRAAFHPSANQHRRLFRGHRRRRRGAGHVSLQRRHDHAATSSGWKCRWWRWPATARRRGRA